MIFRRQSFFYSGKCSFSIIVRWWIIIQFYCLDRCLYTAGIIFYSIYPDDKVIYSLMYNFVVCSSRCIFICSPLLAGNNKLLIKLCSFYRWHNYVFCHTVEQMFLVVHLLSLSFSIRYLSTLPTNISCFHQNARAPHTHLFYSKNLSMAGWLPAKERFFCVLLMISSMNILNKTFFALPSPFLPILLWYSQCVLLVRSHSIVRIVWRKLVAPL